MWQPPQFVFAGCVPPGGEPWHEVHVSAMSVAHVMVAAARKASRALIRDFGEIENLQVSRKGPADFVTAADQRTERILIEELTKAVAEGKHLVDIHSALGHLWFEKPLLRKILS